MEGRPGLFRPSIGSPQALKWLQALEKRVFYDFLRCSHAVKEVFQGFVPEAPGGIPVIRCAASRGGVGLARFELPHSSNNFVLG